MNLSFSFNELLLFQIALAAVFSPFAVIGPYATMTEDFSKRVQRRITFRVSFHSAFFLLVLAWAGELILRILGISVDALASAGGLVLILTSLPMILKGESPRRKVNVDDEGDPDEGWETLVISPLIFPLTMGAGSISLVVTQASQLHSLGDRLALSVICIIHGFVIFATYRFAGQLSRRLGGKGAAVVTRVGGIILLSIAFIVFTNGLKGLLPALAG